METLPVSEPPFNARISGMHTSRTCSKYISESNLTPGSKVWNPNICPQNIPTKTVIFVRNFSAGQKKFFGRFPLVEYRTVFFVLTKPVSEKLASSLKAVWKRKSSLLSFAHSQKFFLLTKSFGSNFWATLHLYGMKCKSFMTLKKVECDRPNSFLRDELTFSVSAGKSRSEKECEIETNSKIKRQTDGGNKKY